MRRAFALSAALLLLAACGAKGDGKPGVRDAWVRLSAVSGRPAAGYFTLHGGARDDRLVRIDSAAVKTIELHEGIMSGGMMMMKPITGAAVPAGAVVEFAPGGNHAMLFDVDPRITPGTAIPLQFTFASGAKIEVEAKTVPAGGDAMDGLHH